MTVVLSSDIVILYNVYLPILTSVPKVKLNYLKINKFHEKFDSNSSSIIVSNVTLSKMYIR